MRFLSFAVAVAWTAAWCSGVAADPSRPLAPDDPSYESGWRPPPSPVADLKAFRPVDARNWLKPPGGSAAPMPPMPGMEHGR